MPFVDGTSTLALQLATSGPGTLLMRPNAPMGSVLLLFGTMQRSPRVASAVPVLPTKIRVTFDGQMALDSRLLDRANYQVAPAGLGATVVVSSVQPQPGVAYPTWVELIVTEMTHGANYSLAVNSGAGSPRGRYGFTVNLSGNTAAFVGLGVAPTIHSVASITKNRADVKFAEPMLDDAGDIRDASVYAWDGGLTTLAVLAVEGDTVSLVTSDQVPGQLYTLTIASTAPPAFTVAPVMSAPDGMKNTETVSVTEGTYTGDGVTITYQWRRDSVNIGGATSNTYVLDGPDMGELLNVAPDIDCVVTATNAFGSDSEASNAMSRDVYEPTSQAGLTNWLDQREQEGTPRLSAWRDQSGNAYDMLQTVDDERFTAATARGFAAPQSTTLAGRNFEGPQADSLVTRVSTAFTMLVAFNLTDSDADQAIVYNNALVMGDVNAFLGLYVRKTAGVLTLYAYIWNGAVRSVSATILPGWHLVEWGMSGGTLRMRLDDAAAVTLGSLSDLSSMGASLFQVGSKGFGNPGITGNYGEHIIYNTALGATPLADARAALAAKWGLDE